jgi:hypothetical protein
MSETRRLPTYLASRCSIQLACAFAAALGMVQACSAADMIGCGAAFSSMHGARSDIVARANEVTTAVDQFEACARRYAGKLQDSCRRQTDDYQRAVAGLHSALDNTDNRIRAIGGSCTESLVEGRSNAAPLPARREEPCDLALSYKGKIPFDGVLKICQRSLSEAECHRCLGTHDNYPAK